MIGNGLTALIVDDELIIRELLRQTLEEQSYACETAASGDEALARLKEREFDVALVDVRMPGISGMDLLATMARSYGKTRVVMVTAVNDAKTAVEAIKKGAADYIVKPFSIDEVRSKVKDALKNGVSSGHSLAAGRNRQNANPFHERMDAIAHGVEARVERFDFHSRIVTEETVEVARQLGLPEQHIREWASARLKSRVERDKRIQWTVGGSEPSHASLPARS